MRTLDREFTLAERILLVVLVVILLGLVYYYFVDVPVRDTIASNEADLQMYQTQIDALQVRVMQLQRIRNNMDELEAQDMLTYMGSYNNSKAEVAFLNEVLQKAMEYTITFQDVTRNGDQIRRNFTLQYKTKTYDEARKIIKKLINGENRCLVKDIRCSVAEDGVTTVNQSATFYETMVGGEIDSGLPGNGASVKQ